jgi:DNA-binding CsgD family transcriptional regulator
MRTVGDDRLVRVLILLLLHQMKGTTQREKAHQLSLAGLANTEIAEFLETSPQVIAQYMYRTRKTGGKKKKKKKDSAKSPAFV